MRPIYLDYNATTPVSPSVVEAITPFLAEFYGNPSSHHAMGRACFEAVEDARARVATLLGCDAEEVIFTSGGTESNNLAIQGLLLRDLPRKNGHLIISAFEHPAVAEPAAYLRRIGLDVTVVPVGNDGLVDPDVIRRAIKPTTMLVSLMHANNEIGTLQPIREVADICHEYEVLVHTDAAQSVGKVRTQVDELGVDMLTVAGHKLYAPKGVGALYVRTGVALEPVMHGAAHEAGRRPGTENVPYLVGLGQAARLAYLGVQEASERLEMLRDRLLDRLRAELGESLTVNGESAPRLPNTLSVNFPDVVGADLLQRTPEVCASTGSACHAGHVAMSPTLAAISLPPEQARGTVRLSLGWYTSWEDVDRAAEALLHAWETRKSCH